MSTKSKILFIINGLGFSNNTGIGGSDKRAIEIIRQASKLYPKSEFDILTTESGYRIFSQEELLRTKYYIIKQPSWWPNYFKTNFFGRLLSYIYCTFHSLILIPRLKKYDTAFATSDFFFDIIPTTFFKTKVAMIHHYIVSPLTRQGDFLVNSFNFLSQKFSFLWIRLFFNCVFLYDTDEGRHLSNLFPHKRVHFTHNGIDNILINNIPHQNKTYDACFAGSIRYSKGIVDLIKIWKTVVRRLPKSKLVIIGGGNQQIIDTLKTQITLNKLENNINLVGPKTNIETLTIMKQSKLFLFPSYEEGWGIALHEALYCGLPAVCYNLPAFSIFKKHLHSSQIGDWKSMGKQSLKLLQNYQQTNSIESINFVSQFTWTTIAKKDIEFLFTL